MISVNRDLTKYAGVCICFIIIATLFVDLFMFPSTSKSNPANYRSLHRFKSSDFEDIFTKEYRGGNLTFGMYIEFKKVAPNAIVYVDDRPPNVYLDKDGIDGRLYIAAELKQIQETSVLEEEIINYVQKNDTNTANIIEGENYALASRANAGLRPILWTIYDDRDISTNQFLLLESVSKRIYFIDIALLPNSLRPANL